MKNAQKLILIYFKWFTLKSKTQSKRKATKTETLNALNLSPAAATTIRGTAATTATARATSASSRFETCLFIYLFIALFMYFY